MRGLGREQGLGARNPRNPEFWVILLIFGILGPRRSIYSGENRVFWQKTGFVGPPRKPGFWPHFSDFPSGIRRWRPKSLKVGRG